MKKRKKYTSGFKTRVVLEAIQERETIQELGKKYDLHPTQISTWKSQFLVGARSVFEKGIDKSDDEKEKVIIYFFFYFFSIFGIFYFSNHLFFSI